MRSAMVAITAALALAACADGDDKGGLFDRLAGHDHIHGDAERVTITGMASAADALPLAIGHCGHFKRSARYAGRSGDDYAYRCVER